MKPSSKVSAIIAQPDDEGRLTVLGTGQRESRGVKRGFITDMAASEHAVREAVELAFFKGLSHTEIAAATRAPLGTVKTRVELGVQKLTHALRPQRCKV